MSSVSIGFTSCFSFLDDPLSTNPNSYGVDAVIILQLAVPDDPVDGLYANTLFPTILVAASIFPDADTVALDTPPVTDRDDPDIDPDDESEEPYIEDADVISPVTLNVESICTRVSC